MPHTAGNPWEETNRYRKAVRMADWFTANCLVAQDSETLAAFIEDLERADTVWWARAARTMGERRHPSSKTIAEIIAVLRRHLPEDERQPVQGIERELAHSYRGRP